VAATGGRLEGTERMEYDVPDENVAGAHGAVSISGTGSISESTTEVNFDGNLVF
jgi:hypothetical protein